MRPQVPERQWTILTGHGHVLIEIARNPQARVRDIAAICDITERSTTAIIADLEAAGYLTRTRAGRRNRYLVNAAAPFRHKAQQGHLIGPLLDLLASPGQPLEAAAPNVIHAGLTCPVEARERKAPPMIPLPGLDLHLHTHPGPHHTTIVKAAGEIDLATAPHLEAVLIKAVENATTVLDMTAVSFLDSSGLRVITQAQHRATVNGHQLHIAAASPATVRVFEIAAAGYFNIHPDTETAVEAACQQFPVALRTASRRARPRPDPTCDLEPILN